MMQMLIAYLHCSSGGYRGGSNTAVQA